MTDQEQLNQLRGKWYEENAEEDEDDYYANHADACAAYEALEAYNQSWFKHYIRENYPHLSYLL